MGEQTARVENDDRRIVSQVERILEAPDDEFDALAKDFIAERALELSQGVSHDFISGEEVGGVAGYIADDRNINISRRGEKTLVLDDPGAYLQIMKTMKAHYADLKTQGYEGDSLYFTSALRGVNNGQAVYFRSWFGDIGASYLSSFQIMDDEDEDTRISVSDVGQKAVCIQRASLSHNSLEILGIDSILMFSDLVYKKDGQSDTNGQSGSMLGSEWHAVVIAKKSDGEYILFDPTNPKAYKDENGRVYATLPTAKKLGNEIPNEVDVALSERRTNADGVLEENRKGMLHYTLYV